jgi:hypothetical protein
MTTDEQALQDRISAELRACFNAVLLHCDGRPRHYILADGELVPATDLLEGNMWFHALENCHARRAPLFSMFHAMGIVQSRLSPPS